jgi:hypothetical protein
MFNCVFVMGLFLSEWVRTVTNALLLLNTIVGFSSLVNRKLISNVEKCLLEDSLFGLLIKVLRFLKNVNEGNWKVFTRPPEGEYRPAEATNYAFGVGYVGYVGYGATTSNKV